MVKLAELIHNIQTLIESQVDTGRAPLEGIAVDEQVPDTRVGGAPQSHRADMQSLEIRGRAWIAGEVEQATHTPDGGMEDAEVETPGEGGPGGFLEAVASATHGGEGGAVVEVIVLGGVVADACQELWG